MKIKHKLVLDFQYLAPDKKIFILKAGTILEDYVYKSKGDDIPIDRDIIDNNQQFFQLIDWKSELNTFLKTSKVPQPAQISKKVIPFIEEMILSSISQNNQIDNKDLEKIKELEIKEFELISLEKRLKLLEEDLNLRYIRINKNEENNKEELLNLSSLSEDVRKKMSDLTEREIKLQNNLQEFNEKCRNFDKDVLKSSDEIDAKYIELQNKIEEDLKSLSIKEKNLDIKDNELKNQETILFFKESEINDKLKKLENKIEEFKQWEEELNKLNSEIQDWEVTHWKFRRNVKPPSAE